MRANYPIIGSKLRSQLSRTVLTYLINECYKKLESDWHFLHEEARRGTNNIGACAPCIN